MTSLNGYIQGLGSGADRIVRKTGDNIKLSVYDNIDRVIVFNEAGETSQKTLTGKNIGVFSEATKDNSQNGTYNFENGGFTWTVTGNYSRIGFTFNVTVGEKYTISYKGFSDANLRRVEFNDSVAWNTYSYGNLYLTDEDTLYTKTITATSNVLFIGFYLSTTVSTGSATITNFQLEKSPTATDYEPYCGGFPSPNPSYPQDIEGIGVKQLNDTYSVTINYDDGDGRTGSVIASGLAYPLYEGDVLDFANGKVIRNNCCVNLGDWNYTQNPNDAHAFNSEAIPLSSFYSPLNTTDAYGETYILYSSSVLTNYDYGFSVASSRYLFYFKNKDISSPSDFKTNMDGVYIVYKSANPTEENITLTGDISDIGTATVTADGTLTVKYDKVEMAIRKYS